MLLMVCVSIKYQLKQIIIYVIIYLDQKYTWKEVELC
jgi:hypothetical protein